MFKEPKEYLKHVPTLKPPNLEEELSLYVVATNEVVSIVLTVERPTKKGMT